MAISNHLLLSEARSSRNFQLSAVLAEIGMADIVPECLADMPRNTQRCWSITRKPKPRNVPAAPLSPLQPQLGIRSLGWCDMLEFRH